MTPEPGAVLQRLRKAGVDVHYVVADHRDPNVMVVYIENRGAYEAERVRHLILCMPGTDKVTFSQGTTAILLVTGRIR